MLKIYRIAAVVVEEETYKYSMDLIVKYFTVNIIMLRLFRVKSIFCTSSGPHSELMLFGYYRSVFIPLKIGMPAWTIDSYNQKHCHISSTINLEAGRRNMYAPVMLCEMSRRDRTHV